MFAICHMTHGLQTMRHIHVRYSSIGAEKSFAEHLIEFTTAVAGM